MTTRHPPCAAPAGGLAAVPGADGLGGGAAALAAAQQLVVADGGRGPGQEEVAGAAGGRMPLMPGWSYYWAGRARAGPRLGRMLPGWAAERCVVGLADDA